MAAVLKLAGCFERLAINQNSVHYHLVMAVVLTHATWANEMTVAQKLAHCLCQMAVAPNGVHCPCMNPGALTPSHWLADSGALGHPHLYYINEPK